MNARDAAAIAYLMRKQHGGQAERFVQSKIRHFECHASGDAAAAAWRAVAEALRNTVAVVPPYTRRRQTHSDGVYR